MFNEDYLVQSDSYISVMNDTVVPWLESANRTEMLPGCDGQPLYTVSWRAEDPAATVFILHGFTENAYKYAELIYSLLHHRYNVVAYDQRGHGRSRETNPDSDASVTHVDRFTDYVQDFQVVFSHYREQFPAPYFLFAHSMGGAVASLFLEQEHRAFSAAVLSAPMIAPNLGGVPASCACALGSFAVLLGKGKKRPFFMKPYSGPESFENSCATDQDRFAWYDRVKASRKEFQNSVPSYRWSVESIKVTKKILSDSAPEGITCPVLLFTADQDYSVLPDPQKAFISRVPNGKHVFVKDSRHEIYRSQNEVLFPWWKQVLSFYGDSLQQLIKKG